MAVAYVQRAAVLQTKGSSSTTIDITNSGGAVTAGNTLVMSIFFDNAATASKPVVTGIAVPAGETATWQFLGAARSTSTSAGAFSSGEMWCIRATVPWAAGSALTVTLDTAVTVRCAQAQEFSGVQAVARSTVGTAYSTTTTAASASTSGTTPVTGDLAVGLIWGSNVAAVQAGSTDTTGGSWSTPAGFGTTGSGGASNNFGLDQYKILTSASAQTYANSAAMTAGNGAIVAILKAAPTPPVTQAAYRFYGDGTESGSTALAAQDTAYTADVSSGDVALQVRTRLQLSSGDDTDAADDWQLQYEKNSNGSWINISDALLERYETTGASVALHTGVSAGSQSFLAPVGPITRVAVAMYKVGTPSGNISAAIYGHSGTYGSDTSIPTGSALATASNTFAASGLATSTDPVTRYEFIFTTPTTLTAGSPYCIVVSTDTVGDTSNFASIRTGTNAASQPLGNSASLASGTWTPSTAVLTYRLYSSGHTVLQTTRGGTTSASNITATGSGLSQSFTGNGQRLALIRTYIGKTGAPTGTTTHALYAHSGTFGTSSVPTGSALHTSTALDTAAIQTSNTWQEFVFDGTYTLTSGSNYCAVMAPSAVDASNYIIGNTTLAAAFMTSGNAATGAISGMTPSSSSDAQFEIVCYTDVSQFTSSNVTDGGATTNRLTGGSGSFVAGEVVGNGLVSDFWWTASNYTELLFPVKLVQAQLTNGDTIKFRVVRNGSTSGFTYSQYPTINVVKSVAITQAAYRLYADGTESGSTALAAQNTSYSANLDSDLNLQVRTRLQSTSGLAIASTDDFQLQYEKNTSGTWTNVTGYNSSNLTDGGATTERLTGGTGTFTAGEISEDGLVDDLGWSGNNYTELLYSITLPSASFANGDSVRFRVLYNGATTNMTYSQYPTISVTKGGGGATGRPKYWTGSAWSQKPLKIYNGSTWAEKPVKVWTGSTWKTLT